MSIIFFFYFKIEGDLLMNEEFRVGRSGGVIVKMGNVCCNWFEELFFL